MKNLLFLPVLFLLFACHNANQSGYAEMDASYVQLTEIPETHQAPSPQEETSPEAISKKLIKTGGIDFESENIERDYNSIRKLLPPFDAYIENESQSKSAGRIGYTLTIRVASENYDSLFNAIASLPARMDHKYSNIEDATERYYDLKARIKNKKTLEQRYLELLNKATQIKDILEIEKNLNEVRTEIERMEGQFNYLNKQISLSTIHLNFYEVLPYTYESSQRRGFGARLLNSLDNGWQGFLTFLVGLTSLWPFLLLTIGIIYLIKKLRTKWKKEK